MAELLRSSSIQESDQPVFISAITTGSDAERVLAISAINRNLAQGCFAVPALIEFLQQEKESTARLQAIRLLGELGACARSAEGILRSIMADSSGAESVMAERSMAKIMKALGYP